MSGRRPPAEAARRTGVALLLAALVLPALFVGLGEAPRDAGPERAVLVARDATSEVPSDCDQASAPLVLLLAAGVVGPAFELPEPVSALLGAREADRLSGDAALSFPPPPPRQA